MPSTLTSTSTSQSDDDIFKPYNKRPRSDSNPAALQKIKSMRPNNNKDVCDTTNDAKNSIFHQPLECCLSEVLEALEVLTRASGKMPASDAHSVHSAIFVVHKQVTALAYRIGKIEKTNTDNNRTMTNQAIVYVPAAVYIQYTQSNNMSTPPSHRNPVFSEMLKSNKANCSSIQ